MIVADDGIATGSTMMEALQPTRPQRPHTLIVAAPIIAPERLSSLERLCDEVVYLLAPEVFWAIGQFYEDFHQMDDEQVSEILRSFTPLPHDEPNHEGERIPVQRDSARKSAESRRRLYETYRYSSF